MKFVYFGDMHDKQKRPPNRIDDWTDTIAKKTAEIRQIAKDVGATALIQPGDFLDSPKVSDEFLNDIIKRWADVNYIDIVNGLLTNTLTIESAYDLIKTSIPIIGVVGNHELLGGSMQSFNKTSLSILNKMGLINLVTKERPMIFVDEKTGIKVAITGSNYHLDIDKQDGRPDYIVDEKLGDVHIHIVHGYATVQDFGTLFAHTNVKQLKDTKADLTIFGHDHIGFDPIEINGKWFVNPGSITRLSGDIKEISRTPKVMVVEVDEQKKITLSFHPLKSALTGSEVLDRSRIEEKKKAKQRMEEIKNIVEDAAKNSKQQSILDIVYEIANKTGLDDNSKMDLLSLFEKRIENEKKPNDKIQRYHIVSLELENFQSHKRAKFDFSPGLNVFTGESRAGKTSIIRAFRWIYENNAKNARRFIHKNEKYVSAKVTLSNGYIIERRVEKAKSGFNGYNVYYPEADKWEALNTKAVSIVQNILGFSDLFIDQNKSLPINFLTQGSSWYFIGDGYTGTERAKAIGTIYQTHHADVVAKELEDRIKKNNVILSEKEREQKELEVQVGCMMHLDSMKECLDESEELIKAAVELSEELEFLKNSNKTLSLIDKKLASCETITNSTKNLDMLIYDVKKMRFMLYELNEMRRMKFSWDKLVKQGTAIKGFIEIANMAATRKNLLIDVERCVSELSVLKKAEASENELLVKERKLTKMMTKLDDMLSKKEELKEVKKIADEISEIKSTYNKFEKVMLAGIELKSQYDELTSLIESKEFLKNIQEKIADLEFLASKQAEISVNDKKIEKEESDLVLFNKKEKEIKLQYMKTLETVHRCPLCFSEIDRDDAIRIAKNKFYREET